MSALPHVEHMRVFSMASGAGLVTALPELCLNISNAYLYTQVETKAREFAERALRESKMCMD